MIPVLQKISKLQGNGNEIPGIKEIDESMILLNQKKYSDALNAFNQIVDKYSDYLSGSIAFVLADVCLRELGRESDRLQRYSEIINTKSKKDITAVARMLERQSLVKEGKYSDLINNAKETINDFSNTNFEKDALYDAASTYWYYLKDKTNGESYYRTLIKKYPDDPLSVFALAALGELKPKDNNKPSTDSKIIPTEVSINNYPNPFNPSTKIVYSLPEDSHVNITIYNSLGQEVIKLIDEQKIAGSYTIEWNPGKLSSGLYYYRIKTDKSSEMRKMIYMK
jgi:tetratricopeptide (TPR) repeat protein